MVQPGDRYITCIFGELEGNKVVQKSVYAKMARGEMVRYMAGIHADSPEQMKDFNWSGYRYDEERSSETEYVFIRTEIPGKNLLQKILPDSLIPSDGRQRTTQIPKTQEELFRAVLIHYVKKQAGHDA